LAMVNFAKLVIPTEEEIQKILAAVARGPCTADMALKEIPQARQALVFRSLAWLAKMGILRFI